MIKYIIMLGIPTMIGLGLWLSLDFFQINTGIILGIFALLGASFWIWMILDSKKMAKEHGWDKK